MKSQDILILLGLLSVIGITFYYLGTLEKESTRVEPKKITVEEELPEDDIKIQIRSTTGYLIVQDKYTIDILIKRKDFTIYKIINTPTVWK